MGAGKKQMKRKQKEEEQHLEAFIKLCPVLSMDEGEMGKHFSANQIFEKLSNVYIERAVRSGYADNSIYNPDQLLNLTPEQEKALGDVHDLLGSMPSGWKPEKININNNGLGNTEGAVQMKYIYYLTPENIVPPRPRMSAESDDNGCPTTDDEGWDDKMCAPSQMFPYLFVSNSRLADGQWSDFSQPVLWKQWTDPNKDTDEAKKKREQENKEKRARMSVLRGVAIRIPLLVYGAEINDEDGEEITIDNFASEEIVDQASWDEFMPRGFTKETFNILKECFDRSIFTGAAKRIRQMVKEADNLNTEDRIAKIATIFSYFHNPDKETVLTPWRVVNMQLSDCIGGWCFFNEQFDAEYTEENQYGENIRMARFVDRGSVTKEIFGDYNARILEINSKTGLYPLYMAYSLFKTSKEPEWRRLDLTGERGKNKDAVEYEKQASDDLIIWRDVLQDNIFVICRTKMAVSITKRTLAGFRKDIRMNVKCYEKEVEINDLINSNIIKRDGDNVTRVGNTYKLNGKTTTPCDLITVLRAKPALFHKDIVKGIDFWHVYNSIPKNENENINNMKFKAIVGNPPYQIMDGGTQTGAVPVYNKFVDAGRQLEPNYLSMIMPAKWYNGGRNLDEFRASMLSDRHIQRLFDYLDSSEIFNTVDVAGGICYFLWNKEYDGLCSVTTHINKMVSTHDRVLDEFDTYIRYYEGVSILKKVQNKEKHFMSETASSQKPFGLRTYARPDDFGELTLISSGGTGPFKRENVPSGIEWIDKWKLMTSIRTQEHAGQADKDGMKRILSRTEILPPSYICTESYIVINVQNDEKRINNVYSYIKTKFVRFLMSLVTSSQAINKQSFVHVPIQDFSRPWTDEDLYKKYELSDDEIKYIESLIKPME